MVAQLLIILGIWYLVRKHIDRTKLKTYSITTSALTDEKNFVAETPPGALNVVIKDNQIDTTRILPYKGKDTQLYEFRPRNFTEFISQEHAKEQAKTIIKKVGRGMKGHLFLSARQGMGKTTFIKLLANELHAKIIDRVGRQLSDPDEIINVINEINTSKEDNVIFFLDETDSCDKKSIKMLNSIIESFEISGKKIKPFIFAGASINKDVLIKNNPDFLDRIGNQIIFSPYSADNVLTILKQYQKRLYPLDAISDNIFTIIATSCKYCPRIAISLLEDYIVEKNMTKVLKNRKIIKDGLTDIDIKILATLADAIRPMGSNAVALRAGLNERQYVYEFEPYLYEMGYINRTPSRVISEKGKQTLKELKDKESV